MMVSRLLTRTILAALLFHIQADVLGQETSQQISAEDLRTHVHYLASDELEGRAPATEGNQKAASYIAAHFKKFGLHPAGDNGTFYQTFEFISGVELGEDNSLAFSGPAIHGGDMRLVPDQDFRPLGFSSSGTLGGPVVFAGYGVSAPDLGYDDYADIDVSGRVVVVLRYTPAGNDPHSDFYKHGAFRTKARVARERGAAGIIVVPSPMDDPADEPVKLSFDQTSATSGIPIISMKYALLDAVLSHYGVSTASLQDSIKRGEKPVSLDLSGTKASIKVDVRLKRSTTSNIVGYLPGQEKGDEEQVLVIGAHMDHLGWGGPGSGSLEPDTRAIHNGADDNASGTAGLLELAEAFAADPEPRRVSLLFIAFSAEEMGTLGSIHYVENPAFRTDQTVAMINMDMIGRLRDRNLTVYGTGTSPLWEQLLRQENADSVFHLSFVQDGFGPSDHAPFYGKDIPVLFFFTGSHNEYHKPGDDTGTINFEGTEAVTRYVSAIAKQILRREEAPEFARVQSTMPSAGGSEGRPFTVTLGVIPDYSAEGEGMKIGGIRPGGPAEKAGLEPGDIIVSMKGKKVLNIYDYMGILGELKAGEEVEVAVLRNGAEKTFTATMQARQ